MAKKWESVMTVTDEWLSVAEMLCEVETDPAVEWPDCVGEEGEQPRVVTRSSRKTVRVGDVLTSQTGSQWIIWRKS